MVEEAQNLHAQKSALELHVAQTRTRFQKQRGWRTLQHIVDSAADAPCLDPETARLLERAQQLMAQQQSELDSALQPTETEIERLTEEIAAVEHNPAVRAYLAEQQRQAEQARLSQQLDEAQSLYRQAQTAVELERIRAMVQAVSEDEQSNGALRAQSEQLLAMIETDVAQARAAAAAAAEREAREQFGQWIQAVSRTRRSADSVLTFGWGQAIHLSPTGQHSQKGNQRVMLVSAVGFELAEPVVRTLLADSAREGYYRLQPNTDIPSGGKGRQFDWSRQTRREPVVRKHRKRQRDESTTVAAIVAEAATDANEPEAVRNLSA